MALGVTTGFPTGRVSIAFGEDEVKDAGRLDGPASGFINGVLDRCGAAGVATCKLGDSAAGLAGA